MVVEGGMVAGRYRLQRIVGSGGMGRVWLARDEVLARDVAVKEILTVAELPPGHADPWTATVREARTAARLTHPNVVRIYDVLFTGGRPWIVMELILGRSLAAAVTRDGPLAPPEAARIGLAVLDGLDAAHHAGVLHRDVKPHNVLLADDGRILLGDFGVAVFDGDSVREEVLLGSPKFIAPERAGEGVSTVRTDLWSFGATLYWSVEGRAPYDRQDAATQLRALATEPPDPQTRSGALAPIIDGLLRRSPEDRHTAATARVLLARAANSHGLRAQGRATAGIRGTARVPVRALPPAATLPPQSRRPLVAGVTLAVLLAVGLGAAAVVRPGPRSAFASVVNPSLRCAATPYPSTDPSTPPGTPVQGGTGPTALPAGWLWATDQGFRTGVPQSWLRSTDSTTVCFVDPTGRRALSVDGSLVPGPDLVDHWHQAETALLAGHAPRAYRRIDIDPAIYRQGAADWEYTYESAGVRWHVQRRVFTVAPGRTFTVSWTTTDGAWDTNQANYRAVMQSFDAT